MIIFHTNQQNLFSLSRHMRRKDFVPQFPTQLKLELKVVPSQRCLKDGIQNDFIGKPSLFEQQINSIHETAVILLNKSTKIWECPKALEIVLLNLEGSSVFSCDYVS